MFVDYYQILDISYPSNDDEIKRAYRRLSLKWHPDRNAGTDTSEKMVEINEAYYILKDPEKKRRYDHEYLLYKKFKQQSHVDAARETNQRSDNAQHEQDTKTHYDAHREYKFSNNQVREDMDLAHSFAKELVAEFLKNFRETSKEAAKGAWEEMKPYLVIALIIPILFALIRSCQ